MSPPNKPLAIESDGQISILHLLVLDIGQRRVAQFNHELLAVVRGFQVEHKVLAIKLDVPMQIVRFLTDSDALALGTLAIFERELLAGEVALLPQQVLNIEQLLLFLPQRSSAASRSPSISGISKGD